MERGHTQYVYIHFRTLIRLFVRGLMALASVSTLLFEGTEDGAKLISQSVCQEAAGRTGTVRQQVLTRTLGRAPNMPQESMTLRLFVSRCSSQPVH